MRKTLFVLILTLFCAALKGEGLPTDFLTKVRGNRVVIKYEFDAQKGQKAYCGAGVITTQDMAYKLEAEGIVIYDDLKSNWTVNSLSKEVVINDSNAVDFFEQPSRVLSLLGMNPRKAKVSTSMGPDGKSFSIEATLADGMKITLRAKAEKFLPKASLSDFAYDTSALGKDWMVTDLR